MSSPSGPATVGRAAGTHGAVAAGQRAGELGEYKPGPLWMRVLPPVVTFAVILIGITVPSYWRDEAATLAAVRRPFGEMIRLLGNVDAVHGAYYMLAWVIAALFGSGELAMRLPSAVAMAVAAGFVAALGRRIVSPGAGLAAGLLFVLVPQIALYGAQARSYAMVVAIAAIASYVLVRALGAVGAFQRRWWIAYACTVALLGILNIFGLLLVPAHGVTIALRMRRAEEGQSRRALALRWLLAVAAAVVVASPLIAAGWMQRGQISWLATKGYEGPSSLIKLIGPLNMTLAVVGLFLLGIMITVIRSQQRPTWLTPLLSLCLPWLVLPPAILMIGSAISPVYNFRYILFCIPAVAVLAGAGIAALGRIGATAALVLVAILSLSAQVHFRVPDGHYDNIRQADRIVAATSKPGDVVLYTNPNAESFGAAYPYGLGRLPNIQLARPPVPSATLGGSNVSAGVLHDRLAHVSRLWIVDINSQTSTSTILDGLHYHLFWTWRTSDIWLRLYVRQGSPAYAAALQSRPGLASQ